jgi:hypothetical protein
MGDFSFLPPATYQAIGTRLNQQGMRQDAGNMMVGGMILSAAGAVNSAIGTFYALDSKRYELKSQASAMDFQKSMAGINASMMEFEAQSTLAAGQKEAGRYSMQAGQAKSQRLVSQAARGVVGGVGSAAEVIASNDVVKQIDMLTINANSVRAAEAQRMQAQNVRTQGAMAGVQANNLRASAGSISPLAGTAGTLLGGAGQLYQSYGMHKYGIYPYQGMRF